MNHKMRLREKISLCLGLPVLFGAICGVLAQSDAPKFELDPAWPKHLPENWGTGQVSGVCLDNEDHVFIVDRNNITAKEAEVSRQAPPFIEFDTDGKIVNGFGDRKTARDRCLLGQRIMRSAFTMLGANI
jgi:hypothetical protein